VLCEKRTVARFAWFLALRLCCVITQPGHIAHAQSELLNIRSILNCRPCGACFPLLLRLVAWVGGVLFSCSRWLAAVFVKQHCAVCRFCTAAPEHCWCCISKLYILQCFVCAYVMHLLFVIITLRKLNTVSRWLCCSAILTYVSGSVLLPWSSFCLSFYWICQMCQMLYYCKWHITLLPWWALHAILLI